MSGYPGNYYGAPPQSYGVSNVNYPGYPQQPQYGGYAQPQYPQQGGYPPQQGYAPPYGAPGGTYASQPAYAAPLNMYSPMGSVAVAAPMMMAQPVMAQPMMAQPVMAQPMMAQPMVPYAQINYCLQFRGSRLDRKDLFSKSDPFLVLMASKHPMGYHNRAAKAERHSTRHNKKFGVHSANWLMIHRTETIHNDQNPIWQPFIVNLMALCGGNFDTVFKIEVWDSDSHSNHDFIGSCVVTMRDLQVNKEARLINKRRIGIYNGSGMIEVMKCVPA